MPPSDLDLLRQYASERSESAFAEIVHRHVDLVYSAAKRLVLSAVLAEEVTQSVFVDLSRKAGRLDSATPLVAWLHVVTRRTAIDFVRAESRRRDREQSAMETATMNSTPSAWSAVEPILDEALGTLDERDRAAVLLRYFEGKSHREIGESLGTTDDAAQKRVSRAVDQLRVFFTRRGLAVTAAGLLTDLSAHAVQTAPAALAATITTKAPTALTVAQTANVLAMTTTQKVLVTAAVALTLGSGIFGARIISRKNAELAEQRQRTAALQREVETTRTERDAHARALADAQEELQRLRAKTAAFTAADPAVEAALDTWLQSVVRLKKYLEQTPSSQIPEMQFLTAKDWLDATKENPLDSEMDLRAALSQLRICAKLHFSVRVASALDRYLKANNKQPPADPTQLAPYFETPVDPTLLQRYGTFDTKTWPPGALRFTSPDGNPVSWVIREKQSVDPYYDTTLQFSSNGFGYGSSSQFDVEVEAAIASFRAANNNAAPTAPAQLASYLHSAIDPAFIQKRLSRKDSL